MDRKALAAIALCVVILIGWPFLLRVTGLDRYMRPPTPPPAAVDTTRHAGAIADTARGSGAHVTPPAGGTAPAPALTAGGPLHPVSSLDRTVAIETPLYRAEFSTRGARLLSVELKRYASAHGAHSHDGRAVRVRPGEDVPPGDRVSLAGGPALALDLGSESSRISLDGMVYDVAESTDAAGATRVLTFTGRDSSGLALRQTWRVRPDTYALDLEVEIHGVPRAWRIADYSLTARSWPAFSEAEPQNDLRSLRSTGLVGSNLHRIPAASLHKGSKRFEGNAVFASVETRYFMGAVVATGAETRATVASAEARPLTAEERALLPANAPSMADVAVGSLVVTLPGEMTPINRFLVYFGPTQYSALAKLNVQLERAVDLGWTWIRPFSSLLLKLMVWLHGLIPNYGITIVLLATLVRLVLHPLNMMSIKSMRAMQRLQPEMERIKKKYENDPQGMNTATMALYRENKVNPAGGCLPMLIQLPLFFALFSVLSNAIELRQAPFVAWIQDLSAPDRLFAIAGFPIRLLPLLMAGSGFLTQRMTPTPPSQASSMYMMNAVMVVFFYSMPSGLVLYWTVMNLLTALQQWLALRESPVEVITTPTEPARGKVARRAASK
jgi:YidC/Oxa1 family membrane protein insertase